MKESDSYREWSPPPAWRHVVACCWEHRVGAGGARRILPDGCADLLLFGSGEREVVGLHDEVAMPVFASGTVMRGIRFRPEAVGPAFGVDAATLRNQTVELADVVGTRRAHRLDGESRIDAWIRSVELDRRVAAAVRLLGGELRVEEVSERLGISERQLRRVVLADVGVAPKAFQRVARLRRLLCAAESGEALAPAAFAAGYADQAHMTREVVRLCGLPPKALLAERGHVVDAA